MSPYESIVLARDLKESMARLVAILATVFAISISSISCIKDDMEEDGKDVETDYTLGFGEIPTSFGEGEGAHLVLLFWVIPTRSTCPEAHNGATCICICAYYFVYLGADC